jgi:hypothetical protein
MKHRSVGAFIILAALFLAVPQASRDLLDATTALGARARTEVLQVLVGLQAGSVRVAAARQNLPMLASNFAAPTEAARPNGKATRNTAGEREQPAAGPAETTGERPLELAMILDPAAEGVDAPRPPLDADYTLLERSRTPLPRAGDLRTLNELAMIIPPDVARPDLAALISNERLKADTVRVKNSSAAMKPAVYVAARVAGEFSEELAKFQATVDELGRETEEEVREGAQTEAADAASRVKVMKLRRPAKKHPAGVACGAPQFIKEASRPESVAPVALVQTVTISE